MNKETYIRAVLESVFAGFREDLIDTAVKKLMDYKGPTGKMSKYTGRFTVVPDGTYILKLDKDRVNRPEDWIPLIRCNECRWYKAGVCDRLEIVVFPDEAKWFFCGYAKKKEVEE